MNTKVLYVFFGKDGLPYKDQERTVHFPILGAGFQGASNTTQIRFYFQEIASQLEDSSATWVATSKLPNGRIGSKVLETYTDSELGEDYALMQLSNFYFQYRGDVFIALQGYQGGVQIDYDDEEDIYTIHGTPTIQATGSIKLTINYAPQFIGSGEEENIDLQTIMAAIGEKADADKVVFLAGTQTITGSKTFEAGTFFNDATFFRGQSTFTEPMVVNGYSTNNGILNFYYTYLTTNSKTYLMRVGVTNGQYIYYDLPYNYSDIGSEQHFTLATTDITNGKVDKISNTSDYDIVYGVNKSNVATSFELADKNEIGEDNQIPRYNGTGNLCTDTPTQSIHAVNKGYVDELLSTVYKPQGSESVANLNAMASSITSAYNGYVYDLSTSGTLINYDESTLEVLQGDNVVLIWNNGDWYWDKLAGLVDLSGYPRKAQNETITGVWNFSNGIGGTNFSPSTSNIVLGNASHPWANFFVTKINANLSDYGLITPDTILWTSNQTIATQEYVEDNVPKQQTRTTIVVNALTNLNGKVLSTYTATSGTGGGSTYYHILRNGEECSYEDAEEYIYRMSGTKYVPTYDYDYPKNSIWIMADGTFWKPQFVSDPNASWYGLYLFQIPSPFEVNSNKVTTLSGSSTNTQYPSAKAVWDNLQDVREVAEGKCKSYILDYEDTLANVRTNISTYNGKVYDLEGNDITGDFLGSGYDNISIQNSAFNSQNNSISFVPPLSSKYLILRTGTSSLSAAQDFICASIQDFEDKLNIGDNIWIINTDVPDRWYGSGRFYRLETIDTNIFYSKSESLIPTSDDTYDLGSSSYAFADAYIKGKLKYENYEISVIEIYGNLYNNPTSNPDDIIELNCFNVLGASSDTTFTFATEPTGTLPEYKGKITNNNVSSSITITLTGVSNILCNDDNIVVTNATNSTFVLPVGTEVEFSIVDGKAILVNFEAQ